MEVFPLGRRVSMTRTRSDSERASGRLSSFRRHLLFVARLVSFMSGDGYSLPMNGDVDEATSVRSELQVWIQKLTERRSEVAAQMEQLTNELTGLDTQLKTLQGALKIAERTSHTIQAPAATLSSPPAAAPKASTGNAGTTPAPGHTPEGGWGSTRDTILDIIEGLGPGGTITTRGLYARMRAEHGYTASLDAVRRAATRMASQGLLDKVGRATFAAAPTGGAVAN